jgi:hypothetical protein
MNQQESEERLAKVDADLESAYAAVKESAVGLFHALCRASCAYHLRWKYAGLGRAESRSFRRKYRRVQVALRCVQAIMDAWGLAKLATDGRSIWTMAAMRARMARGAFHQRLRPVRDVLSIWRDRIRARMHSRKEAIAS